MGRIKKEKIIYISIGIVFAALMVFIIVYPLVTARKSASVDNSAAIMNKPDFEKMLKEGTIIIEDEELPASAVEVTSQYKDMAVEAYSMVNDIRNANGVDSLSWNPNLETCSQIRAVEASQYFSHTRPTGESWWTVNSSLQGGENLAYGYNDAGSVVNAWMASPTHAYNILYNEFNDVSISIYQAPSGVLYWAQEFGY